MVYDLTPAAKSVQHTIFACFVPQNEGAVLMRLRSSRTVHRGKFTSGRGTQHTTRQTGRENPKPTGLTAYSLHHRENGPTVFRRNLFQKRRRNTTQVSTCLRDSLCTVYVWRFTLGVVNQGGYNSKTHRSTRTRSTEHEARFQ